MKITSYKKGLLLLLIRNISKSMDNGMKIREDLKYIIKV